MRKNIIFHIIILGTIIGTFSLGVWQLQRREWKHELIQTLQSRLAMPVAELPGKLEEKWHWRRVELKGRLDFSRAIYIPRFSPAFTKLNRWGYEVYAPLHADNGEIYILRWGWVMEKLDPADAVTTRAEYTALVHPFAPIPFWQPPNQPATGKWSYAAPDFYAYYHARQQNFYLDNLQGFHAEEAQNGEFYYHPVRLWREPELTDNHLQYAITWFALAGLLLALYLYKIHDDR